MDRDARLSSFKLSKSVRDMNLKQDGEFPGSVRRTPPVKGLEKTFNVQKIPPSGKFQNFFLIIKENSMPNLGSKKRVEHSGGT